MDEEHGMLERATSEVLHWGLGPVWDRLAPLRTGAVATSALVVGGATILHRIAGHQGRRLLAFVGGAALLPLGVLLLYSRSAGAAADDSEQGETERESETSKERA